MKSSQSKPLLATLDVSEAEALLSGTDNGKLRIFGEERRLGYTVGAWTGDEKCGAQFDLVLGVGAVGIYAPNSFNLSLMGNMSSAPLEALLDVVIEAFDVYGADVTSDDFLDEMLDLGESIVCPSGGVMAYVAGEIDAPPVGYRAKPCHRGILLVQDVTLSDGGMDMRLATEMHSALRSWRDGEGPKTGPSPR